MMKRPHPTAKKKKKKAFLTALQLPATKEVQKKLKALQRYGVYEPKWNPALKANWTTARVREVEKRFNRFQGDAKIAINHRAHYPLRRSAKGWVLSDAFRFRRDPLKVNTSLARFGITKTQKGYVVPKALGRLTVDRKTGELYMSAKHGKTKHGKRTFTLNVKDALSLMHYATEPRDMRAKNVRGHELYAEIFQGIEHGDTMYSIDFFGTTFDVGSPEDLKRFAHQYGQRMSTMKGDQLGAFTVERYKA